jgi:DHA3 family tetracycline resistance protein-like MFS transporter
MDAYRFYLYARGFYGFCWTTMTVVSLVYMVEVAALDPLQMVLVGTALEVSAFVFEIPTGVIADVVSRKLSVVIGYAMTGSAFMMLALFPSFELILLTQVVWGAGWTFISGAYPAWLTEEIGIERANRAFVRATQIDHTTAFFGIVFGVSLAHVSLTLPIIVGSSGVIGMSLAMAAWMPETGFQPAVRDQRQTWRVLSQTFERGVREVRAQRVLVLILLVAVVVGLFSEGFDRLYVPYLIEKFSFPAVGQLDKIVWWGAISAVSIIAGLVATTLANRYVDVANHRQLTWVLGGMTAAIGVCVIAFAHAGSFAAALACFWIANGVRAAEQPLSVAWLNRRVPAHARATVLSMQGQADSLGQATAGPITGSIAKFVSISAALTLSGLVLLPSLLLYRRAARDER